jgi:hypothetical protein
LSDFNVLPFGSEYRSSVRQYGMIDWIVTLVKDSIPTVPMSTWIPTLSISTFGFAFWQLDHWLHVQKKIPSGNGSDIVGERPFDKWMGIATGFALLPLFFVFHFFESPVIRVIAAAGGTVAVMFALAYVRGLQSGSSMMFQAAHAVTIVLLIWLFATRPDAESCSNIAKSLDANETRVALLTYCAGMTQFWISTWLTATLAFAAMFAATLIAMYAVQLDHFGWSAHESERHVLAIVYIFSTIWILVEAIAWLGIPLFNDASLLSKSISLLHP